MATKAGRLKFSYQTLNSLDQGSVAVVQSDFTDISVMILANNWQHINIFRD